MVKATGRVAVRSRVRRPAKPAPGIDEQLAGVLGVVQQQFRSAMTLSPSPNVFNLYDAAEVERLIDILWSGDFGHLLQQLPEENPELTGLLFAVTGNTCRPTTDRRRCVHDFHRLNLINGIFAQLYRARSQHCTTLPAVLLSLKAYKTKADGDLVDAISCFFKGAIMSQSWTEQFVQRALCRRPTCPFTPIEDFGLTAFDNLQIRIGYKAFATQDTAGISTNYMLDMTNWLTFDIPAQAAPQLPPGRIRQIGELQPL